LTIDHDVSDPMAITGLSMAAQAQPVAALLLVGHRRNAIRIGALHQWGKGRQAMGAGVRSRPPDREKFLRCAEPARRRADLHQDLCVYISTSPGSGNLFLKNTRQI
jgi:hypothetical protein